MRSTKLVSLLLATALLPTAFGCGDDIIFPDPTELPDPALNGVFPAKGFTDRTLRVEISGDGTAFDTTSTVSFGDGITVGTVEVSSTGTLFANITITGDAALGKRDVTVTNGDATLTLTSAFEVQAPLEVALDGPLLQGGLGFFLVINRDPEHPFLGDLTLTARPGTTLFVNDQTENTISGTVFIDVDAASGPLVVSDTLLDTVTSRASEFTITPRTPTALQSPGKGPTFQATNVTMSATTSLFSFTAVSAIYRGTSDSDFFAPLLIWLPGGKWANQRGFVTDDLIPTQAGTMFVVAVDEFLETGFQFDLAVDEFHSLPGAVALAEVEDNDGFDGNAQVINQDFTLFNGLLNFDDTGFDDLSVTVNDGDRIRITTTTGPFSEADTAEFIFDEDFNVVAGNGFETNPFCCGVNFTGLAANDDLSAGTGLFASDVTSDPLPAGTYFVEVISTFGFGNGEAYEAGVSILRAPQVITTFNQPPTFMSRRR